jgi:DHA2 family multidrug resistance protein
LSLFVVGRILGKLDTRLIMGCGFVLAAFSAWQMTGFDLQMDAATVVWSGVAQGLGSGMVFVPVSVAAFSTLSPMLRNEGAAIFSLTRNMGASIGISCVETLLTRNTQIQHAVLAQHVSLLNPNLRAVLQDAGANSHTLAALNAQVTRQAAMIAYNDNFELLLVLCLAVIPFVFLLRKAPVRAAEPVAID